MDNRVTQQIAKAVGTVLKHANNPTSRNPQLYWKHCSKVVAMGRNYADHIAELGNDRPSKPIFFLKPTTSILPPRRPDEQGNRSRSIFYIPKDVTVDYEIELAVIMGWSVSNFASLRKTWTQEEFEERWKKAICGYAVGIDLTARNLQEEAKRAGLPWSAAKGYDRFLPMSGLIPKHKIADPHNVRLELKHNENVVQNSTTGSMLWKIPELFEAITDVMKLNEWDIVLTGTPKGVGQVVAGDKLTASLYSDKDELIERFEVSAADRKDKDGNLY